MGGLTQASPTNVVDLLLSGVVLTGADCDYLLRTLPRDRDSRRQLLAGFLVAWRTAYAAANGDCSSVCRAKRAAFDWLREEATRLSGAPRAAASKPLQRTVPSQRWYR